MAIRSSRVSVGTTPTVFGNTDSDGYLGSSIVLRNRGTVAIYIGGPGVTSSTGFQVDAGETFTAESRDKDVYYAITSSDTAICHVLETGI